MSPQTNSKKRKATNDISRKSKKRKFLQDKNIEKLIEKTSKKDESVENEVPIERNDNEMFDIQDANSTSNDTTEFISDSREGDDKVIKVIKDKKKNKKNKNKPIEELEAVENPFAPISKEIESGNGSLTRPAIGKKRKFTKGKEKEEAHTKDLERTVFIGNVPFRPIIENPEKLKKRLVQFLGGSEFIESIRLRNLPVIVDENDAKRHNQSNSLAKLTAKMSRDSKIHLNQYRTRDLKFDNDYYEVTAYAKLKSEDMILDFMKRFNKQNFEDSIIFVDRANSVGIQYDEKVQKKTAVLGGLPAYIKTKELYDAFKEVEGIHSIRVVRDPVTRLSRGIGYVHFLKKKLCNSFVSSYKNIKYLGKSIRIMHFEVDKKVQEKEKQLYKSRINRNKTTTDFNRHGAYAHEGLRAKHNADQYRERIGKMPDKYWQGNKSKEKITSKHKKVWKKFQD